MPVTPCASLTAFSDPCLITVYCFHQLTRLSKWLLQACDLLIADLAGLHPKHTDLSPSSFKANTKGRQLRFQES